jgi:uncharacterized protein YwgA
MYRIEIQKEDIVSNLLDAERKKEATKTIITDTKKSLKSFLIDINRINGK